MGLRETAILAILLALAPIAAAQDDPTVNESDYDTTEPTSDESYLDESAQEAGVEESSSEAEPTVSESDFDTSEPTSDESYLDEAERDLTSEGSGSGSGSDTPGLGLVPLLGLLGGAALVLRRK